MDICLLRVLCIVK